MGRFGLYFEGGASKLCWWKQGIQEGWDQASTRMHCPLNETGQVSEYTSRQLAKRVWGRRKGLGW